MHFQNLGTYSILTISKKDKVYNIICLFSNRILTIQLLCVQIVVTATSPYIYNKLNVSFEFG
jgi:hypothetical protein